MVYAFTDIPVVREQLRSSRFVGPLLFPLAKFKVKVVNPVSGHQLTFISQRNAERYVKRGRARWRGEELVFIEGTHDRLSAERLASQGNYDRIGQMSARQVTGIPMLGDVTKLFTRV